jgi:hypothetical protein
MILTSEQVRTKLKAMWPDLTDDRIWLRSKRYKALSMALLIEVVGTCSIKKKYRFIEEGFECESYSDQFKSAVLEYQYQEEARDLPFVTNYIPYLVANAICLKANGVKGNHNIDIVLIEDGFAFVEPQTDDVWLADNNNDYPYFIFR